MPVIDSVNRKGVTGALGKRVTKGPYWLVGPKSGDIRSDFSRLSGIRGKVDQYEITNGTGTQAGSYTITIRPFAERGFPALHRAVGDVAVFRQINGVASPGAAVTCMVRKRPYSGSVPLTLGPVDVLAGDRLWVVVENKDASTLKYKIDVAFDLDNQASLDLRFAETKSLVDATTGNNLVTFARGSSGTYVGSDGLIKTATTNEPRFDHDPVTGESLGLLVEEQRVNLLQRTEEFNNIAWLVFGSTAIAANEAISPRGTSTADVVTVSGSGAGIYQNAAVTPGASYTASVYVRLGTLPPVDYKIAFYDNTTSSFITQDITPNQLVTTSRWVRISHTIQAPAGCTSLRFYPFRNSASVSGSLYLWGAQLEAGVSPTSYIENVDNPLGATRAADAVSIDGANFSSWYNASEGTVLTDAYADYAIPSGSFPVLLSFSDGTSANRIESGYLTSTLAGWEVFAGGVSQAALYPSASVASRTLAASYKQNDFSASVNGTSVVTDTAGTVPVINSLTMGSRNNVSNRFTGTLKRVTYWPSRLPNSTLQTITL